MERKIHFRENWLIFWGIWGDAELILSIWGAKEKYFQGAEEFSFGDFEEINALFSGIKEAQTPWAASKMYHMIQIILQIIQNTQGF